MILGTGIDIVEVARIEESVGRFGERFLERILVLGEREYCGGYPKPGPQVAARFAAKEAVAKAFGTGIGESLGWQDIEIVRGTSGEPRVQLHGKGLDLLASRGGRRVHVSLSHTRTHAVALAIVEG